MDVERLLWMPKPIIVVPAWGTVGAINRSTYSFWRNQAIYGGRRGGGKTAMMENALAEALKGGSVINYS